MKTITAHRIAALDNLTARLNGGYLRYYDGTKPTRVSSALIAGNHVLAELRYNATAFAGASADGNDIVTAVANAIVSGTGTAAAGAGTVATFASGFASDGTTRVADFTLSLTSGDIVVNTLTIIQGAAVAITSHIATNPDGT